MSSDEKQLPMFDDVRPWMGAGGQTEDDKIKARHALQLAVANSLLNNVEQKVAQILHRYPLTRDDDIGLVIEYWRQFHRKTIADCKPLELEVMYDLELYENITRMRRFIQHDLKMYIASPHIRRNRGERQMEFYNLLAAARSTTAEVRVYLDDTGNEGKGYTGYAGICAINWKQWAPQHAALCEYREKLPLDTVRFADLDAKTRPHAIGLLEELRGRCSGLLFLGHAVHVRGDTHRTRMSLLVQLVIKTLEKLDELKCLTHPMGVLVVKEAEDGFDKMLLEQLKGDLAYQIAYTFPDRVKLNDLQALPKGRELMLELADLIAGAMQRRTFPGGYNPKDRVSEIVYNLTGFEDPRDAGTVFKTYF